METQGKVGAGGKLAKVSVIGLAGAGGGAGGGVGGAGGAGGGAAQALNIKPTANIRARKTSNTFFLIHLPPQVLMPASCSFQSHSITSYIISNSDKKHPPLVFTKGDKQMLLAVNWLNDMQLIV
jgi:hypothetical protein